MIDESGYFIIMMIWSEVRQTYTDRTAQGV